MAFLLLLPYNLLMIAMAGWQPSYITRFIQRFNTSSAITLVETNLGQAYIKTLGNPAGPHALVCEWIGTSLAKWLGVPTLNYAIININEDNAIPLIDGDMVIVGPAFATSAEKGLEWSGTANHLQCIDNPEDITKLVLLDTWLLNCDRFPPKGMDWRPNRSNVFLSDSSTNPGKFILKAIDHTHCFSWGKDLTAKYLSSIDKIKDKRVYGLFPEFRKFLSKSTLNASLAKFDTLDDSVLDDIFQNIPAEWSLDTQIKGALKKFILGRSYFVKSNISDSLWPQWELNLEIKEWQL